MTSGTLLLRSDPGADPSQCQPAQRSVVRKVLAVLAWLYVACLTVQVFLAGLGVFVSPIWFQRHKAFVHSFGWLDVVLLILAVAARAPRRLKRLAVIVVVLVGMQYSTILLRGPLHTVLIGAFHPVTAVLLYATALALARGAWALAWPSGPGRADRPHGGTIMRSLTHLGIRGMMIVLLLAEAARARAQTNEERSRSADSLRAAIDTASARNDWTALQETRKLADRLLAEAPNDARLRYYQGYTLFRLALIASRGADRHVYHDLLSEADRALETSAGSLDLAETHALRASVLGQLIGVGGNPLTAMRLGSRSGGEMKRALALGPANPRVWLLRGINTMHTPKMWGGGLAPAEEYLLKAQALFLTDTTHAPNPTWGKADVEIALGQLHLMANRRDAARLDFTHALTLEPQNAWVRDTLMREATNQRSSRTSP